MFPMEQQNDKTAVTRYVNHMCKEYAPFTHCIVTKFSSSQVAIDDNCLPKKDLCSTYTAHHQKEVFMDPAHLALCQNFTFWNTTKRENQTERRWCRQQEEVFPCTGNFPGFYTCANYSFGNDPIITFGKLNSDCEPFWLNCSKAFSTRWIIL